MLRANKSARNASPPVNAGEATPQPLISIHRTIFRPEDGKWFNKWFVLEKLPMRITLILKR